MKEDLYSEAEELYVKKRLSLNTVAKIMEDNVSRRTIYNWAKKGDWEEKRRMASERKETLEDEIWDLLQSAIQDAKANTNPRSIFAVAKLAGVLKTIQAVQSGGNPPNADDEEEKPKQISEKTIGEIRELLGI